jgi:hypothetical protein
LPTKPILNSLKRAARRSDPLTELCSKLLCNMETKQKLFRFGRQGLFLHVHL